MYKRILVVVGTGPNSRGAVAQGVELAKSCDAEALFAYVLPRYVMPVTEMPLLGAPSPDEFQREARIDADRTLAKAAQAATKAGVRNLHTVTAGADDAECIADIAKKRRCDLIVVASAGRNAVMRLLTGSIIPGLITLSPVPVLICRPPPAEASQARMTLTPHRQRRRKFEAAPRSRPRSSA